MPYGQDAKIGIAFQNSQGTAASTSSLYPIGFTAEDIMPDIPELLAQNMTGNFNEGAGYGGPRQVAGSLQAEALPQALGVYLKALFGGPTTTNVASSVKQHVFKPRTSDFDVNIAGNPISYYKSLRETGVNTAFYFHDLVAGRLELRIANGEFLTSNIAFVGGKIGKVSSLALAEPAGKNWTWDVTSVELGGAANIDIEDITITIDEQLEPKWVLNASREPLKVKRGGKRQVRIAGTIQYNDQDEYDKFVSDVTTTQALRVTMTGAVAIQSGYYPVVKIEIPAFKWLDYKPNASSPGEIAVAFSAKGDFHIGSDTAIAITLTNTQQTY